MGKNVLVDKKEFYKAYCVCHKLIYGEESYANYQPITEEQLLDWAESFLCYAHMKTLKWEVQEAYQRYKETPTEPERQNAYDEYIHISLNADRRQSDFEIEVSRKRADQEQLKEKEQAAEIEEDIKQKTDPTPTKSRYSRRRCGRAKACYTYPKSSRRR